MNRKELFSDVKRIVVKIGTNSITNKDNSLNLNFIYSVASQIKELQGKGIDVLVVSSGAIGAGLQELSLEKADSTELQQTAASVGQPKLMAEYERALGKHGLKFAQVLLTSDCFENGKKFSNLKNTLNKLLELKVVPIINENDAISVEEIGPSFTDNDGLSALVATNLNAQLLITLTDTDGFFDNDPKKHADAHLMHFVENISKEIEACASGAERNGKGRGGMCSKLQAAKICKEKNCLMVIANSSEENVLKRVLAGEEIGTLFA